MCSDSSEKLNLDDLIYKGKGLWEDPHKDEPAGVLLSDQIEFYIKEFRLVVPYKPAEALRSAQYTLRVGEKCYCNGKTSKIDKENPVEIAPNELVYIQIYEYLNMPYYLIARYSLRVKQVYRGLIVDNGLQVDPGFHGRINVPVYNFTDEFKKLEFKERLLSVDFVKTTPFRPNPPINAKEEREWVRSGLVNTDGMPLKLFQENPDKLYHQESITSFFRDNEKNESSVQKLDHNVKKFGQTINQFEKRQRIIIWGTAISVAALIIMVLGYIYVTHDSFAQARIDAGEAKSAVKIQQLEIEKQYKERGEKLNDLEKKRDEFVDHMKEIETKLLTTTNNLKLLEKSQKDIASQIASVQEQIDNQKKTQ